MKCFIDGTALCITGDNFINLQESAAIFIELPVKQREEIIEFQQETI